MFLLLIFHISCSIFASKQFSLPLAVSGNWTAIAPTNKLVVYFITLGFRRFEALLFDNLLNVNVTRDNVASVKYKNTTFEMKFSNYSTRHYYGFAKINDELQILVEFYSQYAVDVTFINPKTKSIDTYLFTKKPQKMKRKNIILIMSILAMFFLFYRKVMKQNQQQHPHIKKE